MRQVNVLLPLIKSGQDVVNARAHLETKHRLSRFLRFSAMRDPMVKFSDPIELQVKRDEVSKRKLLRPPVIHLLYRSSDSVTVPIPNVCTMDAAINDFCAALAEDSYMMMLQEIIDAADSKIASAQLHSNIRSRYKNKYRAKALA